jgi:hypothetical protein
LAKRHNIIPPPTDRSLILLAGLPTSIGPGVVAWLERYLPNSPKIVAVPGQERDGYLYRPEYVGQCLEAASGYAERLFRKTKPQPAPNALALAFVPDDSQQNLLRAFSFSAFPIPLTGLEEFSEGRQMRHHAATARERTLELVREAAEPMGRVRQRLITYSPREPLFLPPHNFETQPGVTLAEHFMELRDGTRDWGDPTPIEVTRATYDDLPKHAREHGLNVSIDARRLLFPRDLSGHGGTREVESADSDTRPRENLLRTLYRFGAPLPEAFHHDVQYAGERTLADTQFVCSVKGRFVPSTGYVNIYPDDFVRRSKT